MVEMEKKLQASHDIHVSIIKTITDENQAMAKRNKNLQETSHSRGEDLEA